MYCQEGSKLFFQKGKTLLYTRNPENHLSQAWQQFQNKALTTVSGFRTLLFHLLLLLLSKCVIPSRFLERYCFLQIRSQLCSYSLSLQTDFLLVVLRDVVQVYPEIRVVLMSATIDTSMFREYFFNCPIIEVYGRTFPVQGKSLVVLPETA